MKMRRFKDYLKEQLKDPVVRKAFEREKRKLEMAARIADIRRKKKLTQAQLARKMGTTQQTVSRLESGEYDGYTLKTLERVARATKSHLVIEFRA